MAARRYLVTGGTGFIGAALVRRLVREGHQVRVVDNDLRGDKARLDDLAADFELIDADVRNTDAMTAAARGVDSILHLAALNGTANFYDRPDLVLDVGVKGMFAALEAARANGVEEFFLASSSEAYQTPSIVPTPEDVPLMVPDPWNPRYSYGGSKLISEVMLANINRDLFRKVIVFRPHNVYGPAMGFEHVLPQLVLRAYQQIAKAPAGQVPFEIQRDGAQTRAFIHIDDFIEGLMLLIQRGAHRNCYNIGTLEEVSIRDVVQIIFDWFGREAQIIPTPAPAGGTPRRCPDISKLAALGFAPKIKLANGIDSLARWYVAYARDRL